MEKRNNQINNKPEKMKIISKNNYKLSKKYSHGARALKILDSSKIFIKMNMKKIILYLSLFEKLWSLKHIN